MLNGSNIIPQEALPNQEQLNQSILRFRFTRIEEYFKNGIKIEEDEQPLMHPMVNFNEVRNRALQDLINNPSADLIYRNQVKGIIVEDLYTLRPAFKTFVLVKDDKIITIYCIKQVKDPELESVLKKVQEGRVAIIAFTELEVNEGFITRELAARGESMDLTLLRRAILSGNYVSAVENLMEIANKLGYSDIAKLIESFLEGTAKNLGVEVSALAKLDPKAVDQKGIIDKILIFTFDTYRLMANKTIENLGIKIPALNLEAAFYFGNLLGISEFATKLGSVPIKGLISVTAPSKTYVTAPDFMTMDPASKQLDKKIGDLTETVAMRIDEFIGLLGL